MTRLGFSVNRSEGSGSVGRDEREERILAAAEGLIIRFGFDKTTVSEIAEAAGVSKGAIYLHFSSKEALMDGLLARAMEQYSAAWMQAVEQDPQGGTIGGMYRNVLKAIGESPLMEAMLGQDSQVLGSYLRSEDTLITRAQARSMRAEFVALMQQRGCVRSDVKAGVVAHVMDVLGYGMLGIGDIKPREEIPPLEETVEMIGAMLDRWLTPAGVDSEAGKEVLRELMREQAAFLEEEEER